MVLITMFPSFASFSKDYRIFTSLLSLSVAHAATTYATFCEMLNLEKFKIADIILRDFQGHR